MEKRKARRTAVPKTVMDSKEFAGSHYSSAFELPAPEARSRTPEQWGRAAFEGAPAVLRAFLVFGWTGVLRLRMGPRPSAEHVLGWHMSGPVPDAGTDTESLVMEAHSGALATYNVVVVTDTGVLWATAVHFKRPVGRVLWRMAQPIHHLSIPRLLRRAGRAAEPTPP